jgi:hypothetical protein
VQLRRHLRPVRVRAEAGAEPGDQGSRHECQVVDLAARDLDSLDHGPAVEVDDRDRRACKGPGAVDSMLALADEQRAIRDGEPSRPSSQRQAPRDLAGLRVERDQLSLARVADEPVVLHEPWVVRRGQTVEERSAVGEAEDEAGTVHVPDPPAVIVEPAKRRSVERPLMREEVVQVPRVATGVRAPGPAGSSGVVDPDE